MTRSVYLLALIASATVVSAELKWTLTTEQACTAIGTYFCGDDQYTKVTPLLHTSWTQYPTEAECKAAPSCYAGGGRSTGGIFCWRESTATTNRNTVVTNFQPGSELSASQLKCFLPEGKTSIDDYVNTAAAVSYTHLTLPTIYSV